MRMNKQTVKRILCLCLAFVMLFTATPAVEAATKGFYFKYNKVKAIPGEDASKFIEAAGEADDVSKTNSCATKGYDYTYTYEDFILETYTEKKTKDATQYVNSITFLTDEVKTPEGIKIGSKESTVKRKYKGAKKSFGVYSLTKGETKITVEVEDKKVTAIKIMKK